jgi:hypothetical protein
MPATQALLGKAGQKLFEQHMERYAPQDPLYEIYKDDKGKERRRKVCFNSVLALLSELNSRC